MSSPTGALKRLILGRAFATDRLARERLPKRLALPTFSSDALSSVAYAPDQILLTLALAGVTAWAVSWWVAVAVVVLMGIVVMTGLNTVHEFPGGGGDYEVAQRTLGGGAGRAVGAALLVDYVLTVAVSVSQAAVYASGLLPVLHPHETAVAIGLVLLVAVVNLRGVRQSSALLAIPVYLFMGAIGLLLLIGAVQALTGTLGQAPSAQYDIVPASGYEQGLTAVGGALLILRAFASGSAALTGVEAVGNGVPSFQPPKSRNAAIVLLALGGISSAMILGVIGLAGATGVRYVLDPATQLARDGSLVGATQQIPVIGQIAQALSAPDSLLFYAVTAITGTVLFVAANTAFNGFPNLASVLARSGYLPKQMRVRGDRLVLSNGILLLAVAAMLLVWATGASVTFLIQMYIVGVFLSFSLGQLGMIRYFTGRIRLEIRQGARRRLALRRAMNTAGFLAVTIVLVIMVITKFSHGAWAALLAMAVLWLLMTLIHRHYRTVKAELALPGGGESDGSGASARARIDPAALPSRSHALVLLTGMDRPTLRAVSVASAARHSSLEAIAVHDEDSDMIALVERWKRLEVQVPLRVLYSPYRDISGPVLAHVMTLLTRHPRDVVIVYLPEFLVGHWWESVLHNHSSRRLGRRLAHLPRVVVASVPWQLGSAQEPGMRALEAGVAGTMSQEQADQAREEAVGAALPER